MKKKNLRDSTNEKSELLKEKLRERELESKRRKSHKLIRLAEKESALITPIWEGGGADSAPPISFSTVAP